MQEFQLEIGQAARVRTRWWGRSWSVIFAGHLADGTCCLVVAWSLGHNSAAYNLFLPPGARTFRLPAGSVEVVDSGSNRIRLRVVKE